jgi:hypothetical protein
MRVMVSLNLADIMTAARPTTSQPRYETANNQVDSADLSQESQLPTNSEPITKSTELHQFNAEGVR